MTRTEKIEAGEAIRRARHEQELTQFAVAMRAQVTPSSIWFCEHGAASDRMFARVAKALKVKLPANGTTTAPATRSAMAAKAAATGGLERPGFLKVPHALLDAAPELRLAPAHLLVALRLLADCQWEAGPVHVRRVGTVQLDAGEAVCGTRNLARRLRLDRETVRWALERLEAVGWFSFRPAEPPLQPPLKAPLGDSPTRRRKGTPPPTIARVLVWRDVQWPGAEVPPPMLEEEPSPRPLPETSQNSPRSKTHTETVLQALKGKKGNGAVEAEGPVPVPDLAVAADDDAEVPGGSISSKRWAELERLAARRRT